MSLKKIEETSIWKNTLASRPNDEFVIQRDELRSSFIKFRAHIEVLVSRIAVELPGLTLHDINHLDTLWETASLIAGENFHLTPLEGFVFGGAILVHDSGLCFEAYENGHNGIRKTIQWKDAYAYIEKSDASINKEELEYHADFLTLRKLHSHQAAELLGHKWIDPDNHQELYLLENQELRKHLGPLIGQIAASHNWNIETMISKLPSQLNAISPFPREWRIDPVKIACLLRCADAIHFDNERAPDFLYALLKRQGISLRHWQAQNKLSPIDIDQSDPEKETLIFSSTNDFSENESDSWFIAYDAACLIDKELKQCNALLYEHNNGGVFKVNKVRGIESPESMSKNIRAIGWKPCSAQVHVSNIDKIIQNLAGEKLYGSGSDLLEITIRELVQNARDAIIARKFIEREFDGKITVKIQVEGNSSWLIFEDNGVGMSERVLTGSLLDFGTSFWISDLVQSEFPGLLSSNFHSIGQFGIGFYSTFMISQKVLVASRKWDEGLSDINELKFVNGFSLRPIITKGLPEGFGSDISTQIKILLKPGILPKDQMMTIKPNIIGLTEFKVPFTDYIASICAGLDVPIHYLNNENRRLKIHENIESINFDVKSWLEVISYAKYQNVENMEKSIDDNYNRLRKIIENDRILGFAAVNILIPNRQLFLSVATVGGLTQTVHHRYGDTFIGYIDYCPLSAKREIGEYSASQETIIKWAKEQLDLLTKLPLTSVERYCAASSLSHFKVDPSSIAQIRVSHNGEFKFYSFDELADLSNHTGIAFLESSFMDHMDTMNDLNYLDDFYLVKPIMNSNFLSVKITNKIPENNLSILDCLYRAILKKGLTPKIVKIENVGVNSYRQPIHAIILSS